MPTIPVYSSSPINAAKASGITPKTSQPAESRPSQETPGTRTSTSAQPSYPQAKPGAVPSLPTQTAAPQAFAGLQPTPTSSIQTSSSPPAPQPGAVPAPTGGTRYLPPASSTQNSSPPAPQPGPVPAPTGGKKFIPPPPKAGESLPHAQPSEATTTSMPHQMMYQPPTATHPIQGRSSTASAVSAPSMGGPHPISLQQEDPDRLSHPPGYQQNVAASEFSSYQRAAHHASVEQNFSLASPFGQDGEPGLLDSAKKWVTAAGESIAAAENEVWKRINKD